MNVRADSAVSAYSPLPSSIKALPIVRGVDHWTRVHPTTLHFASIQNKPNFAFYQLPLYLLL